MRRLRLACFGVLATLLTNVAAQAAVPTPEIINIAHATYTDNKGNAVALFSSSVSAVKAPSVPGFTLTKTASNLTPKTGEEVLFDISAAPGSALSGKGIAVIVDGQAKTLEILRDAVPAQTEFVRFENGTTSGVRLYHKIGDALQTYATTPPGDLRQVDAVALGLTDAPSGSAIKLRFTVQISVDASKPISNTAEFYSADNNSQPLTTSLSNTVRLSPTRPVDPFGIVFDSKTNAPLAGARVTLIDAGSGVAARVFHTDGTPAPNVVITGADGRYSFPVVAPGSYRLDILPAPGYVSPSQVSASNLPAGRHVDPSASYDLTFTLGAGSLLVTYDIPLDRVAGGSLGLFVQKLASRQSAEIGDAVDYTVRVKNVSGVDLTDVVLNDELPHGFVFDSGSARINAHGHLKNASGDLGPYLKFSLGSIKKDETVSVNYRAKLGPNAPQGDGINRAQASNQADPRVTSNVASARVQLEQGVFTTRGIIIGKVFVDANRNRIQDEDEPGIPGVWLYLEDGSYVITDEEGKYDFYGLSPRTHILKLDKITLPAGAKLEVLDNRNAGTAGTRFVELKNSEMQKANFAVADATPEALAQIEKLRAAARKLASEADRSLKADLTRDGQPLLSQNTDRRALPASGLIVPGSAVQPTQERRTEGSGSLILGDQRFNVVTGASNPRSFAGPLFQDPTAAHDLPAEVSISPQTLTQPASAAFQEPVLPSPDAHLSSSYVPVLPGDPGEVNLALFGDLPRLPASNVSLQQALPNDNTMKFGFVDLRDGDTLPMTQATVRVKGLIGARLQLKVNGAEVAANRVGKRITVQDQGVEALEFIGVALHPGSNELELAQFDNFGNARGAQKIHVIAPDKLGVVKISLPNHEQPADGHTPAHVSIQLLDASGVAVTARTELTLEASLGVWNVKDLNPDAPGVQVFIEGGYGEFDLQPPVEPGNCTIRVSSGVLRDKQKLAFLPDLRPMLAAGLVEGRVQFSHFDASKLTGVTNRDTFDQELRDFSVGGNDGNASARAAFFLKGKIKGDYLLTASYDSERDVQERLFRDIQPDEFYPVYGDSAVKGFEAQSTGPLYVRIDNKRSYLLYGDFVTQSAGDFRQLGNYNRSLTGMQEHFENQHVSGNAWASFDSTRQVIEEVPANGTSGPYLFNIRNVNGLANSEKVEVITRARNNPGLIVKTEQKTRFSDYEFEPFTGRVLFKAPVPSLDVDLNPISIRITYEADQGGPKFWTYGADGQVKVTDRFEVGGAFSREENPMDHFGIYSGNAVFQVARDTFLLGEFAHSEDELLGDGNAYRVELRHQADGTAARIFWGKAETAFHNPASVLSSGRTEGGAQIALRLAKNTRLLLEGVDTEASEAGTRRGVSAAIEQTLGRDVRVEVGGRYSTETGLPASASTAFTPGSTPNEVRSVRTKITLPVPFSADAARIFGEYEQDIFEGEKRMAALGGEYQMDQQTRLYARHEFISSLGGPFELNTQQQQNNTVVGVESTYAKDAQLFNEYRVRDGISGRENEAAIGLRNSWPLAPGLRGLTSFERVAPTGNSHIQNESTAVTGALEYTANPDWKGTARLELRRSDVTDSLLNTLGLAWKINQEWTALGKTIVYIADNKTPGAGDQTQARIQGGLAWRPADSDRWNALGKYEFRTQDDGTQTDFNTQRCVHIISCDVNYQPSADLILSGHYAGKFVTDDSNARGSSSSGHLVAGRAIYDLSKRWDVGVNTSALIDGGGAVRYGVGPEIGLTLYDNLRVGVGYNLVGFVDRDLSQEQYTQQGFYLAMRLKFDEDLFKAKRKEEDAK